MSESELDALEATVPELAVRALNEAQHRARVSGCPMVLVVNDQLVRIGPEGTSVLKSLPSRVKVTTRTKRATS
jgi:hypothetical protein